MLLSKYVGYFEKLAEQWRADLEQFVIDDVTILSDF